MRFFEYIDGEINPLIYPMTSKVPDNNTCFLIWADNKGDAERAAKEHFAGKPFENLHNYQWSHEVNYKVIENVAVGQYIE